MPTRHPPVMASCTISSVMQGTLSGAYSDKHPRGMHIAPYGRYFNLGNGAELVDGHMQPLQGGYAVAPWRQLWPAPVPVAPCGKVVPKSPTFTTFTTRM